MQIDQLELKKICIKYAQFDPHPIWQFVSVFTKKRVEKELNDICNHGQTYDRTMLAPGNIHTPTEDSVVKVIQENANGRRRQYAKYLLMAAIPKKMISAAKAKEMAELLGIAGPDFDSYLTKHFGEEPQVDIFDELAGTNQNNSAAPAEII